MNFTGQVEQYIIETNHYIENIINNRKEIFRDAVEYFCNGEIEQIYLIGTGTSLHSHLAAKMLMEKLLKMPIYVEDAMAFNDFTNIYNQNSMMLASSHSGMSSSTVNALKKAKGFGLKTITSTAIHNSEITKHGDKVIYCEIGEENAGPKTKGYLCAIVTDIVFALEVALKQGKISQQEENHYFERIIKTSSNIPNIVKYTKKWYRANSEELLKCNRLVLIGYSNNLATYLEATLKLLESVRYSVTGYELEQFMHGIYHSIWKNDFMFYIGSKGKYYERMLRMKKYFEERTEHNFIFTYDKSQENGKNFIMDFVDDEDFSYLEYIVPFQVLTTLWSKDLGINCNIPSDPDFHKKMGSYIF
ncbi:MAG: SIS domain-containing protein [Rickettsiales bacterium]|nr:SIS domain-containing protein [Rickettsiales bacterium]